MIMPYLTEADVWGLISLVEGWKDPKEHLHLPGMEKYI